MPANHPTPPSPAARDLCAELRSWATFLRDALPVQAEAREGRDLLRTAADALEAFQAVAVALVASADGELYQFTSGDPDGAERPFCPICCGNKPTHEPACPVALARAAMEKYGGER